MNKKRIIILSSIVLFLIIALILIINFNKTLECTIDQTTDGLDATTTISVNYKKYKFNNFKIITKVDITDVKESKDKIIETFNKEYVSTDEIKVEITSSDEEINIIQTSIDGYSMKKSYSKMKKELINKGYKCK